MLKTFLNELLKDPSGKYKAKGLTITEYENPNLAALEELHTDTLEERREKRDLREIEILMDKISKARNRQEKR